MNIFYLYFLMGFVTYPMVQYYPYGIYPRLICNDSLEVGVGLLFWIISLVAWPFFVIHTILLVINKKIQK